MLKTSLRFVPVAAGLLTAALFTACSEPAGKACEGDECASGNVGEADAGEVQDAGKLDSGSKDAGKPVVAVDSGASPAALVHLPCDVKPIVEKKCGLCHGSDPSAPMSLVTAADFQAASKSKQKMYASAQDKINATIPSEAMPPASAQALTDSEKATLNAWLTKGAPGSAVNACGTSAATTDGGVAADASGPYVQPSDDQLECFKLLAHNGDGKTPMNVGVAEDVYYAYTFAAPWKETAYGIVIRSVVDNKKALHHWLLFQDLAPGIPSGAIPQIGAHPTGQLIAAWAPGADDMDFRKTGKEVALELPADTTYTVEFHYNSSDPAAQDASGVEVCTARQKPANIAAYSWVGQDNLGFPSTKWVGTCSPLNSEPIHIVSFMPHMHLKGIHMKGTINRKDGTKEVVHDQPFDFNYQRSYAVDVTMNPGDTLTTECDYSAPAVFGQPTDQEMCYLFSMAYPKGALAAPDIWGTVAHGASSCLGQ